MAPTGAERDLRGRSRIASLAGPALKHIVAASDLGIHIPHGRGRQEKLVGDQTVIFRGDRPSASAYWSIKTRPCATSGMACTDSQTDLEATSWPAGRDLVRRHTEALQGTPERPSGTYRNHLPSPGPSSSAAEQRYYHPPWHIEGRDRKLGCVSTYRRRYLQFSTIITFHYHNFSLSPMRSPAVIWGRQKA